MRCSTDLGGNIGGESGAIVAFHAGGLGRLRLEICKPQMRRQRKLVAHIRQTAIARINEHRYKNLKADNIN